MTTQTGSHQLARAIGALLGVLLVMAIYAGLLGALLYFTLPWIFGIQIGFWQCAVLALVVRLLSVAGTSRTEPLTETSKGAK